MCVCVCVRGGALVIDLGRSAFFGFCRSNDAPRGSACFYKAQATPTRPSSFHVALQDELALIDSFLRSW